MVADRFPQKGKKKGYKKGKGYKGFKKGKGYKGKGFKKGKK